MSEEFARCDLCGEHHEKLVGEQEGECPEAWAVEYVKKYESMYLKWCESEKKIDELEKMLAEKQLTIDAIYNIDTKFMYDGVEFHEIPTSKQMLDAIFELIEEREPKWRKEAQGE